MTLPAAEDPEDAIMALKKTEDALHLAGVSSIAIAGAALVIATENYRKMFKSSDDMRKLADMFLASLIR